MSKENQASITDNKTLVTFPCTFNFKAMLKSSAYATDIVIDIIQMTAKVNRKNTHSCLSKNGKYISITAPAYLEYESQLIQIYRKLRQHPQILMIL